METVETKYTPSTWEKIVAFSVSFLILCLIAYLVIRNEPFTDNNLVAFVRIILSLAIAVLAAVIPGFFHLNWSGKGATIRTGGAMAVFAFTYMFTPNVLENSSAAPPVEYPWYKLVVSDNALLSESDPEGAIIVADEKFTLFMEDREADQGIFFLSVSIPDNIEINDALSIQVPPNFGQEYYGGASYSFGDITRFQNGFGRRDINRFTGHVIYMGFFQVFTESCFSGLCYRNVQLVPTDPARSVETYLKVSKSPEI